MSRACRGMVGKGASYSVIQTQHTLSNPYAAIPLIISANIHMGIIVCVDVCVNVYLGMG